MTDAPNPRFVALVKYIARRLGQICGKNCGFVLVTLECNDSSFSVREVASNVNDVHIVRHMLLAAVNSTSESIENEKMH